MKCTLLHNTVVGLLSQRFFKVFLLRKHFQVPDTSVPSSESSIFFLLHVFYSLSILGQMLHKYFIFMIFPL